MKSYLVTIELGELKVFVGFMTDALYLPRTIESLFLTYLRYKGGNIEQLIKRCLEQIGGQLVALSATGDTLVSTDNVIVKAEIKYV